MRSSPPVLVPGFCSSLLDRSSPLTRNRKAGPSRNRLIPNAMIREIRILSRMI